MLTCLRANVAFFTCLFHSLTRKLALETSYFVRNYATWYHLNTMGIELIITVTRSPSLFHKTLIPQARAYTNMAGDGTTAVGNMSDEELEKKAKELVWRVNNQVMYF